MKKIIKGLLSLLSASRTSLSSKRLCGITGWIICLAILIYCTISVIQAPTMITTIIIASTALLGVDSITNIWKNEL